MMPVPLVLAGKAVVQARESTMEPAPVERAGVKSTAVETAVKRAKSTVETPAAPVRRCLGEFWLAEDRRAQERSCNAHHGPRFPGPGSAIA